MTHEQAETLLQTIRVHLERNEAGVIIWVPDPNGLWKIVDLPKEGKLIRYFEPQYVYVRIDYSTKRTRRTTRGKKKMKNIGEPPIGIIITMGKEVLDANGGGAEWQRHFEGCVRSEDSGLWLHKSRNAPKEDIAMVYIIAENLVQWKVFYGGYERGETSVWMRSGEERKIAWPRMVLAGPFEKAPHDIPMRGFQGFRYIYEPLW